MFMQRCDHGIRITANTDFKFQPLDVEFNFLIHLLHYLMTGQPTFIFVPQMLIVD